MAYVEADYFDFHKKFLYNNYRKLNKKTFYNYSKGEYE